MSKAIPIALLLGLVFFFVLPASAQYKGDDIPGFLGLQSGTQAQGVVHAEEFVETFKEYPPSQAPASFTVDPDVVLKMLKSQQAAMGKD
jgi:hypothetical protein